MHPVTKYYIIIKLSQWPLSDKQMRTRVSGPEIQVKDSQEQPEPWLGLLMFFFRPSVRNCRAPIVSHLEHSCCCIYLLESNHWRRGWSLGGRPHPTRSPGVCSPTSYHIIHRIFITNRMATYMYILLLPASEMIRFQCIRSLQNCWTILFTFMREKDIG